MNVAIKRPLYSKLMEYMVIIVTNVQTQGLYLSCCIKIITMKQM